jgi:hypothetical protein
MKQKGQGCQDPDLSAVARLHPPSRSFLASMRLLGTKEDTVAFRQFTQTNNDCRSRMVATAKKFTMSATEIQWSSALSRPSPQRHGDCRFCQAIRLQ